MFGERLGAIQPISFSVSRGVQRSGGLLSITNTDDHRMVIRSVRRLSALGTPGVELTVEGVSAVRKPTELFFRVEVSPQLVRTPTWIDFFNFRDERWERVAADTTGIGPRCDSRGGPDDMAVANVTKDAPRFVDPDTGRVRAKVRFYCPDFSTCAGWTVGIDWVGWAMTEN